VATSVTSAEIISQKAAGAEARGGSRLKRAFPNILVVVVTVIICLVMAEGILRLTAWPAPGLEINGRGPIALRQPGANGGAFPPGTVGRLRHYDYDVSWAVNSQGFRDRELTPKQPGEWRIGVLGDSFAAGFGVEQPQRFPELWYEATKRDHPRVTLWNLASPLCGTICETDIFNGVGQRYELDEVLLVFYGGNDVEDNFEWVTHPGKQDPYSGLSRSVRTRQWIREHSRLTTFIWINAIRAFSTVKPPGIYSQADLTRYWPYTAEALGKLKQSMGSRRFTILYLPALPEWDGTSWRQVSESTGAAQGGRSLVKQALKEWAQQEKIDFIDSTAWLGQCRVATDCTFPTDGHLNVRGHAIIGNELAAAWKSAAHDE